MTTIEQLRVKLGLNLPLYRQYWNWLSGVILHFNLGRSFITQQNVWQAIRGRLGVTLTENVGGILLSLVFGIPLGIVAALRRGGRLDRIGSRFHDFRRELSLLRRCSDHAVRTCAEARLVPDLRCGLVQFR